MVNTDKADGHQTAVNVTSYFRVRDYYVMVTNR